MKLHGYGILQPGDRQRELTDAEIKAVDFVVLRDRWKYLHVAPNVFDLARLERQINRCARLNKKWILAPMTGGDCTPDWIEGPRLNWTFGGKKQDNVLAPWAPALVEQYDNLMMRLAVMCSDDDDLAGVWITGPTVPSQEMHTNGLEKQKGYTARKMELAWLQCAEIVGSYFAWTPPILSVSGQTPVQDYVGKVVEYVEQMHDEACFQHNSLGTQTNVKAKHHQLVLKQIKKGFGGGAEMVQPGQTAGISKFPEALYVVGYPGDEKKKRPKRPSV